MFPKGITIIVALGQQYIFDTMRPRIGNNRRVIIQFGQPFQRSMYQPGMVAKPSRGQLNRQTCFFSRLRSFLRLWSRETGSAVPSRVSQLILHTQAESSIINHQSSIWCLLKAFLPLSATASIYTVNRHRVSPEFIESRNYVYRWRSLPRVRRHLARSPQSSSSNGFCLFRRHHGPIFVRLSFPTPTIGGWHSARWHGLRR